MTEAFYWILIPTVFLAVLVGLAGIYETFFVDSPFKQGEWRRKANERFAQLIRGDK
jgi:hypothetical protein